MTLASDEQPLSDTEKEACAVYVMRMALEDFCIQSGTPYEQALEEFARSDAYAALFDFETGFWREGPDCIRALFEKERSSRHR